MAKDILARLGEFMLWLLRWYLGRVATSWRNEIEGLKGSRNRGLSIVLCIVFTIFLFPYLTGEAFSDSFLSAAWPLLVCSVLVVILIAGSVYAGVSYNGTRGLLRTKSADTIRKGETLTDKNIRSVRPANGIPPKYFSQIVGRRAKKTFKKGSPLKWNAIV